MTQTSSSVYPNPNLSYHRLKDYTDHFRQIVDRWEAYKDRDVHIKLANQLMELVISNLHFYEPKQMAIHPPTITLEAVHRKAKEFTKVIPHMVAYTQYIEAFQKRCKIEDADMCR